MYGKLDDYVTDYTPSLIRPDKGQDNLISTIWYIPVVHIYNIQASA